MRKANNMPDKAVQYEEKIMIIKKENFRLLLIGVIVLIVIGAQDNIPKRAVADVEGKACVVDEDCPCWGKLKDNTEAFGIGAASCSEETKTCDTSFCVDIQPAGEYLRDKPFQWVKDNIMLTLGIIGLLVMLAYWPIQ